MQDLHSDISIEDDVIDLNNKVGNAAFYAHFILFLNKNLRVVNFFLYVLYKVYRRYFYGKKNNILSLVESRLNM
jgi:hypothetical protein